MSGIFGIVRFGSYPADRAQVDQMATAIARWGNQPATLTHDDSGTFGHVLRVETPEDAHSLSWSDCWESPRWKQPTLRIPP